MVVAPWWEQSKEGAELMLKYGVEYGLPHLYSLYFCSGFFCSFHVFSPVHCSLFPVSETLLSWRHTHYWLRLRKIILFRTTTAFLTISAPAIHGLRLTTQSLRLTGWSRSFVAPKPASWKSLRIGILTIFHLWCSSRKHQIPMAGLIPKMWRSYGRITSTISTASMIAFAFRWPFIRMWVAIRMFYSCWRGEVEAFFLVSYCDSDSKIANVTIITYHYSQINWIYQHKARGSMGQDGGYLWRFQIREFTCGRRSITCKIWSYPEGWGRVYSLSSHFFLLFFVYKVLSLLWTLIKW